MAKLEQLMCMPRGQQRGAAWFLEAPAETLPAPTNFCSSVAHAAESDRGTFANSNVCLTVVHAAGSDVTTLVGIIASAA